MSFDRDGSNGDASHWLYPWTLITLKMSNTITSQPFVRSFEEKKKHISPSTILNNQVITLIILGNFLVSARGSKLWTKWDPAGLRSIRTNSRKCYFESIAVAEATITLQPCYRIPNEWFYCFRKKFFVCCFNWTAATKTKHTATKKQQNECTRMVGYIVILCVIRAREKERRTYNLIRLRCCWKTTGAKVIRLNTLNVLIAVAIAHVSLKTFSMGRNCTYIVFRLLPLPPNDFLFLFVSLFFCSFFFTIQFDFVVHKKRFLSKYSGRAHMNALQKQTMKSKHAPRQKCTLRTTPK